MYASRAYVEHNGAPDSIAALKDHPLIGFDESVADHRLSMWLREIAPDAQPSARTNSVLGLVSAAKAGVGIAALPTALGDAEADLVRVLGPIPALSRAWRLLAHPDVRDLPKVAMFFDFVASETAALKTILTG